MTKNRIGKIIEPSRCNIRNHERKTAQALANTGLTVEFVLESTKDFSKSPDVLINGRYWEMKSPTTGKLQQIENNLKKASRQSNYIIIDSQRIKGIPDKKIQAFLIERLRLQKSIKQLLFINRHRKVLDLYKLI